MKGKTITSFANRDEAPDEFLFGRSNRKQSVIKLNHGFEDIANGASICFEFLIYIQPQWAVFGYT
jgi:hypothetical protein